MADEQPVVQTPALETKVDVKEPVKETVETTVKTFTEDEINRIVKERLDRERKKYADYNELKQAKVKLDEIESANKTNEEKALAKLKALEDKIAESEKAVQAAELREKKRSALETAKLGIPKDVTLSEMLDMIPGESEEAIESAIMHLKKLFPEKQSAGMGTQTVEVPNAGKKTIDQRLAEIQVQVRDRTIDNRAREELAREMLKLTNRKLREGNANV